MFGGLFFMPSELKPVATPTQSTNTKQVQEYNGPQISPDPEVNLGDIMPISSYEGEKGFPFAAEYYKLDTPYEFLDSEIREDIEAIDGFVKDFIKDEEKEDTIASYAKTLKALEKKLGIEDSMLRGASIKKVASLVKNYAKVAEVYEKNVKRKILNKLIKMSQEGKSQFNQTEYLLQEMGGMF